MRILQFADSTLPVGAFSFSHGLESAVALELVKDASSLQEFVEGLTAQAAGVDGVALLAAYRDPQDAVKADKALYARKLNEESRTMAVRMGKKLAEVATLMASAPHLERWLERVRQGATPGNYAVGQGVLFADLQLGEAEAFAVHQYGVASAVVGAALRLMRLDHREAQRILFAVNARAQHDYARVRDLPLEEMAGFAPTLDILASVHVQAHVRLFMN